MEEGSRLKSTKEPKERKQSSAKPRKTSARSKQQAVIEPAPEVDVANVAVPQAPASAHAVNGSSNGATAASPSVSEAVNGTADTFGTTEKSGDGQATAEADPPRELIEVRAYELFVQRGYEHGHHEEDWVTAERELKSRHRNE